MAGTHAGLIYNTWPDMNGHALPESWDAIALIQFLHRNLAVFVTCGFVIWWYYNREYVRNKGLGKGCAFIVAVITLQFALGVLTLINAVPVPLAMMHQMVGMLLFIVQRRYFVIAKSTTVVLTLDLNRSIGRTRNNRP